MPLTGGRLSIGLLITMLAFVSLSQASFGQSCNITSFAGSYGSFDPLLGAAVDASTTVTVNCNGSSLSTVRLCIEIGPGSNTDASGNRVLQTGSNTIRHEYYTTAGRSSIWGSWGSTIITYTPNPAGVTADLALNGVGFGAATFTIYGRVLASQQTAVPGSYSWTSANSPGIRYGYTSGLSCPTGSFTSSTGGSSWSATVNSSCYVSATSINFGSAGALSSNIDTTGTVSVQCTNTTPYKIAMSYGTGTGAGVGGARYLSKSGVQFAYNLYKDAARSVIWGNNLGVNTNDATGTGANQNFTVYGRVPAQTTPAAGNYTDLITVTVNY
jgi:spore coat protein U-like protein